MFSRIGYLLLGCRFPECSCIAKASLTHPADASSRRIRLRFAAADTLLMLGVRFLMSTVTQLAKEFWLPLLFASAWTLYSRFSTPSSTTADLITAFSASFFFLSWLTGQYFRVRKQVRVDQGFETLEDRLKVLANQLESSVETLHATLTGGSTYCSLSIANLLPGATEGVGVVNVVGDHPMYDVNVRIVDLDALHAGFLRGDCQTEVFERSHNIGNIGTGRVTTVGWIELGTRDRRKFNIFWSARNAIYHQKLRLRRIGDAWCQASRVAIGDRVIDKIDDVFCDPGETVDWTD